MKKRKILGCLFRVAVAALVMQTWFITDKCQAKADNVVVVIDPGHGGSNNGAQYYGIAEKNITLKVANAMYQELSQYEGITVYMTRTEDAELSLGQRADFAKSVGADFLYSIHFNASSDHRLYGSEVWTSAYGKYYADGYSFGMIEENELKELGIFDRGVKTKLSSSGNSDYYGIINKNVKNDVPAVIIEHCYMDNKLDENNYGTDELYQKLGKTDATAVAKYYGLKSTALGTDYSGFQRTKVAIPKNPVAQDTTAPEVANLKLVSYDAVTNSAVINLQASDSNGRILYFDISLDGGQTYSYLHSFIVNGDNGDVTVNLSGSPTGDIVFRVYNQYYIFTETNHIAVY